MSEWICIKPLSAEYLRYIQHDVKGLPLLPCIDEDIGACIVRVEIHTFKRCLRAESERFVFRLVPVRIQSAYRESFGQL